MPLERRALLATAGSTLAVGVAGCLGNDDTPADGDDSTTTDDSDGMDGTGTTVETTESTDTTTSDPSQATVQVQSHDEHGDVLVGADGMTLYMFDQDAQGENASSCYDSCASNWPPLTIDGDPTAGEDVTADLSTFERDDGSTQVAANGWPLYFFANDESPGDANGQGAGDVWWVLQSDGTPVRPDDGDGTTTTDDSDGTTTTDDGGGYGGGGYG